MQYQENQITQNYPQNQQYMTPVYNQLPVEQYNSNQGVPIQYYEKPQPQDAQYSNDFQVPNKNLNNYNIMTQPQPQMNQLNVQLGEPQEQINQPLVNNDYLSAQDNGNFVNYINNNTLTIHYQNASKNVLYGFVVFTSIIIIIFAPSFHKKYTILILLTENIIYLYFLSYKIELTKDFTTNKIKVKKINYLCRIKESFAISIENFYFNIRQSGNFFSLIIINNFKIGEELDLNTSNIRNCPAKSIYYFDRIDINKFNGSSQQLNNVLEYFIRSPDKSLENPLNFNINAYKSKSQSYYSQRDFLNFNKYIKFNEHFFSYFNGNPLENNSFHFIILQLVSFFVHFIVALSVFLIVGLHDDDFDSPDEDPDEEKEEDFMIIFLPFSLFFYPSFYLTIFLICKCIKCFKADPIRIDVIFSRDFDKLFIGVVNINKNLYLSTTEFNISEIDKFILSKNTAEENGFHLIPMYKGDNNINNMGKEIAFIKDSQTNLEGLVYILNEKLIPYNNNLGNQNYNELCPTPSAY